MMNQYLVITGGSGGIGLATAKLFQEKNFKVINLSRTKCPLAEVEHLPTDLTQENLESYLQQNLVDKLTHPGKIVVVHNASRLDKDTVENIEPDNLRSILEVNLVAPTIVNQIVLPKMPEGSAIIYIGSTLSEKAISGAYSYVVSKHASVGLMRATCQDLINRGIHTACICPGFTDTPMLRTHLNHDLNIIEQIKSVNAQNRLIEPAEIASTIYFAAMNSVVNGTIIHANMGQKET